MEQEAIESAASEISSWIQDAVSDIAYDQAKYPADPETVKKFEKAKRNGVTDIQGWYADVLYNDVDTLQDLTGDRIYDAVKGKDTKERWENMILIAEAMNNDSHPALVKALNYHIKNWKNLVTKLETN